MGNRIEEGLCIKCGFVLIDPKKNDFCQQCATEVNREIKARIAARKTPKKRIKMKIGMLGELQKIKKA